MIAPLLIGFGVAAISLLLVAEYRQHAGGVLCWKMAAATGYLALALAEGGLETPYGQRVLAALALSWLGDLLLVFDRKPVFFQAGLGAFLAAHLCYLGALRVFGWDPAVYVGASGVLMLLATLFIWRAWLSRHVAGGMRVAVPLYIVTILLMAGAAVAVSWRHGAPVFTVAAALFAVSDLAVARQQFVEAGFENKLWGLPLYFGAQFLFAATVGMPGHHWPSGYALQIDDLGAGAVWTLASQDALRFDAGHPQGFARAGGSLFLSTVRVHEAPRRLDPPVDGYDRTTGVGEGWLYRLSTAGEPLDSVRLGEGPIYHPGGIDFDGRYLWVPVAEYRPNASSIVYRVDPETLAAQEAFRFPDHLGGIVRDTEADTLYAVSWGSRRIYAWPMDRAGRVEAAAGAMRTNHGHYIDYQDCQFAGRGTAVCSGVKTHTGPDGAAIHLGGLEQVDLRTGRPLHTVPIPLYTPGGTPMTQNPVQVDRDGATLRLLAVPEDGFGTLYLYTTHLP